YVEVNDPSKPVGEACLDYKRVDYYYRHLYYVQRAIKSLSLCFSRMVFCKIPE
ncbi:Glycosidase, partial [Sarracenia purpurea var. burkii]